MATVPPSPLPQRSCANHPDRPGHALCMSCRKVVCQECSTLWDGIHYCVLCLARQRSAARDRSSLVGWAALAGASLALFLLAGRLMAWAGALAGSIVDSAW